MDLALKGADIAYKQGNVKAASELTAAAGKRLDAFDRDTFSNMGQALIAGQQRQNEMMRTQITNQTNLKVAGIQARKLDGTGQKLAAARLDPDFYKVGPDGEKVFDFGKYIRSTASTMYPGKTEADIKIARDALYGETFKDIRVSEGKEAAQQFLIDFPMNSIYGTKSADNIIGN